MSDIRLRKRGFRQERNGNDKKCIWRGMDWIHAEHFISIDPEYAGKIFVNGCERKCFRIRGIFRNDAGLS